MRPWCHPVLRRETRKYLVLLHRSRGAACHGSKVRQTLSRHPDRFFSAGPSMASDIRRRGGIVQHPDQLRLFDAGPAVGHAQGVRVQPPFSAAGHVQFTYDASPSVFGPRTGSGPLVAALDTNLLIHVEQSFEAVESDFGFGAWVDPAAWDGPVPSLRDLFKLWFWRDIRWYVSPLIGEDARKPLDLNRERRRRRMVEKLQADFAFRGAFEQAGDAVPQGWPRRVHALLPQGHDRELVSDALAMGCHCFLTEDQGILRKRPDLAALGIMVLRPSKLLHRLWDSGELAVERSAPGPLVPDLLSMSHFYGLVEHEPHT